MAVASLFAVTLSLIYFRQRPANAPSAFRFRCRKDGFQWYDFPVISPNGQRIVLPGAASDGVRHLDSVTGFPRRSVSAGNRGSYHPFWSPDSRSVAFFAKDELKRIDLAGGPPQTLCDAAFPALGGAWNQDGVILLSTKAGASRFRHWSHRNRC